MNYKRMLLVMSLIHVPALCCMSDEQFFITRLQQLPPDIKKDQLLRYLAASCPQMEKVAERIRGLEPLICPDVMLQFFNTLYYKAHAIDLGQRLKDLGCMQNEKITKWLAQHKEEVVKHRQLLAACELGDQGLVKFLLDDRNIDLNAQDEQTGYTPAMLAVKNGEGKIVMQLIAVGADFDKKAFDGTCARSYKW